jgi:hypothetical protein
VRNLNLLFPATFMLVSAVWMLTIIVRKPAHSLNVNRKLSHQQQFQVRLAAGTIVISCLWMLSALWPILRSL